MERICERTDRNRVVSACTHSAEISYVCGGQRATLRHGKDNVDPLVFLSLASKQPHHHGEA